MIVELYFVTSNQLKLREARQIVPSLKHVKMEIPEMQELDIGEVVREKALKAYEMVHLPVVVDDTGLHVNAWNGFPGALGKWLVAQVGAEGICKMMSAYSDRRAVAETRLAVYDGKKLRTFVGTAKGTIARKPRGSGFGFDPIFIPRGHSKTYGEMSIEEKNKISPRGKAFQKLRKLAVS